MSYKASGRLKFTYDQSNVIPAETGIQRHWFPASAGMTVSSFLPLALFQRCWVGRIRFRVHNVEEAKHHFFPALITPMHRFVWIWVHQVFQ